MPPTPEANWNDELLKKTGKILLVKK